MAIPASSNWQYIFYQPNPVISFTIPSGASAYTIWDVYSNQIANGSLSTSATSLTATSPNGGWLTGWYFMQLTGPSGYFYVVCFSILNNDSRFVTAPTWGTQTRAQGVGTGTGDDIAGYGISAIGAYRYEAMTDSAHITDLKNTLALWSTYQNSDTVREQAFIVSLGGQGAGSDVVDSVNIGNLRFCRRGSQTNAAKITIGPGTTYGYKLTVTDTTTATVVETHDNCLNGLALQSAVNQQSSGWLYAWGGSSTAPTQTTAISAPAAPTISQIGAAGTNNYWYEITAVTSYGGETIAGPNTETTTGNATLSTSNYNHIAWTAVSGASTYNIYRSTDGTTFNYIGTASSTSFNDTGQAATTQAPPTADQSGEAPLPNTYTLAGLSFVQAVYNYNSKGVTWFTGPYNEPSNGDPAASAAFISIVHAANSGAKAAVADFLSAQHITATWVAAMQEIGVAPDGFSFHAYNCLDSADLAAEDQTFAEILPPVRAAWGNIPVFITEYGLRTWEYATISPYLNAMNYIGNVAFLESVGIPKENFYWFYGTFNGFSYSSWWEIGNSAGFLPMWTAARAISERLYGTTFAERITLPEPLNKMFIIDKWTDGTNQTWLFLPVGTKSADMTLQVSGVASLTVYDWAGNASSVPVTNGQATLTATGLGTWVVVPLAATISVSDINQGLMTALGPSLANDSYYNVTLTTSSTNAENSSGNPGEAGLLNLNGLDPMTGDRTGIGLQPWNKKPLDSSLPMTITANFATPTQVDRAIILCPPPIDDSVRNALTQFEIQYQPPGSNTWATVYSYNATADAIALANPMNGSYGISASQLAQWEVEYQYDCAFPAGPVLAQAVQLVVQATSYGQTPNATTGAADTADTSVTYGPYAMLRFFGLYCTSVRATPPILLG